MKTKITVWIRSPYSQVVSCLHINSSCPPCPSPGCLSLTKFSLSGCKSDPSHVSSESFLHSPRKVVSVPDLHRDFGQDEEGPTGTSTHVRRKKTLRRVVGKTSRQKSSTTNRKVNTGPDWNVKKDSERSTHRNLFKELERQGVIETDILPDYYYA